ncbi:asparagine synthase (glutamine-hydrolyzing) [Saccharicrinis sp. FJH54]|uniref:asparagine synthase (glutamine-hydrolyzing) n=1 Tax=Saccharicrinis sp. FJH54 TaxID=3344665 RepID=UPI0035D4BFB1
MCGIVGIINKSKKSADESLLRKMADKIAHRGPDDEGYNISNNVGLGHKRLSIIDLKSGHQPMACKENTIVFNGEIYNYIELRESLKNQGYQFETDSDTEVILKSYEAYGADCLNYLNGMFAFVIYDNKASKVFIARDHFGIKPLYYFNSDEHFLFGSEIKALLAHPAVHAKPNDDSLQEYLTFQFVMGQNTMFDSIYKILPGHYMVIDLQNYDAHQICYWEPHFEVDEHHTELYFVEELRSLLEDTIKIQLRSDVPLGTYLSGGMDSSIVTLLASKYYDGRLKTFTGAFREGKDFDETYYAKEVSKAVNGNYFEIFPTQHDFTDTLTKLIYQLDEPVAGPGIFPQYMVSKLAKENVTVVLGGQGGDEIFGGYARYMIAYFEQAVKGAMFESTEEGEHIVSLESIIPNLPYIHRYVPMMREFWEKGAFDPMDRRYFHLLDRSGSSLSYFTEDFQQTYNKESVFERFQKIFNHPDTKSYYNKMTHFDMFGSLLGLLQVEDRVSMSVSLESRVPLLDRRIVDLVAKMPPAMKYKGAGMKYLLKKATQDILPEPILNRKDKMGFPVPLHLWAKNGASDFIRDILLSKKSRERGIFDHANIEDLIASERSFGRSLWGLLSLELWFNTYIDN